MASSVATARAMERWELSPFLMIQAMGLIVLTLGSLWIVRGRRWSTPPTSDQPSRD